MATKKSRSSQSTKKSTGKKAVKKTVNKAAKKSAPRRQSTQRPDALFESSEFSETTFKSSSDEMDFLPPPLPREEEKPKGIPSIAILALLVVLAIVLFFVATVYTKKKQPEPSVEGPSISAPNEIQPSAEIKKEEAKQLAVPAERTHTVKAGDTLSSISQQYLGNPNRYPEIMRLNALKNATEAKPGRVLKIPAK